jgi:hypothetical protein
MSSTFVKEPFTLYTQGESTTISKSKKGKKIVVEEEKVSCISFLHIFQDLVIGNG